LLQSRIGSAIGKLAAQVRPGEPACTAPMGHDVCHRLAVHGKGHSLAGSHGVNHPACLVTQIPDADVHMCDIVAYRGVFLPCPQPPKAPLADLQHLPVGTLAGHVVLAGPERDLTQRDAPLVDQPPGLRARDSELLGDQPG
jgi:hypothetical protein